jgi:pimeloyl-ACP methyl ester carboxylesterase
LHSLHGARSFVVNEGHGGNLFANPGQRLAFARRPARTFQFIELQINAAVNFQNRDALGLGCLRFDYSGHGQSEGRFEDGTVSRWLEETRAVLRQSTEGPQVLIGSSMGGHIALLLLRDLLAAAPAEAQRIKGLVLIAPAWNLTELMWNNLPTSARREIEEKGVYLRPSRYEDGPYPITAKLIEDGKRHLIGNEPFDPGRPVHILHGLQDPDVPWEHTLDLVALLSGDWTRVAAVPDGEHRLSRPEDIALLLDIIGKMVDQS